MTLSRSQVFVYFIVACIYGFPLYSLRLCPKDLQFFRQERQAPRPARDILLEPDGSLGSPPRYDSVTCLHLFDLNHKVAYPSKGYLTPVHFCFLSILSHCL
jgi:hypothetical protein